MVTFKVKEIRDLGEFVYIPFPSHLHHLLDIAPGEWREALISKRPNGKFVKGLLMNFGMTPVFEKLPHVKYIK